MSTNRWLATGNFFTTYKEEQRIFLTHLDRTIFVIFLTLLYTWPFVFETTKKGMLKGLGKLGGPMAAIGAAEQIADFTGLTRGARGLNLGFGAAGAAGSMQRALAGNVAGVVPFGEAIFANTTQTLGELDRSQSSVSGIAEQVARAGGSLSRGGIKEALRRQNEIEKRVSGARNLTEEMQGELVTEDNKMGGAAAKDLGIEALIAAIDKLTDAFASRGGGATGGGR